MCNTKLSFYIMYFHINNINLFNFKNEIISLYENKNLLYNFHTNYLYYIHLFEPSGIIICNSPFNLLSLNDKEDIIEDYYNKLISYIDVYLRNLKDFEYPSYIGLYISLYRENKINPSNLIEQKQICINNINKMNLHLLFPMPLLKKW